MSTNTKKWIPHVIAFILFVIIPIIYFLPALQGKALLQSDITNFRGVAKEILDFRAKYHTEPLWTNSMFGGMPAYQISTEYPTNLIRYIYIGLCNWLPFPASLVFLYCIGFYILMRALDVNAWVSILGSLAFAFSSFYFIIIAVGHNSQANAIAFMGPTLAGVILAFKGKRVTGAILSGLALALELFSDHLQITYYLLMMIGIYTLIQLIISFKQKQLPAFFKTVGLLAVAAMIAIGTNVTNLWLTYDYGKYSTRGTADLSASKQKASSGLDKDYALQWSYGVPESMTLLIPNFQGGASQPIGESSKSILDGVDAQYRQPVSEMFEEYFGTQSFTAGPVYVGAIICFFALLGFFLIKGPMKWFLLITSILSVMLSWGKNFLPLTDIFFNYLPGYNKFRAVSMILIIAEFTLPLTAALAIDRLLKSKDFFKEQIPLRFFKNVTGMRIFIATLCLTAGIALLCYIMPTTFVSFAKEGELNQLASQIKQSQPGVTDQQINSYLGDLYLFVEGARKKIFTADALRTAIFILLAAGLVWVYVKKMINEKVFVGVLLFFILMDMYNVDRRYLSDRNFTSKKTAQVPYQPDGADLAILQDSSLDYRVFNTTMAPDQDGRTSYFHKSLGGYSGVKMRRYHELLDQIETGNMSVINMLNAKYFIVRSKEGRAAQQNPGALGNAWFVDQFRIVPNADSERTALLHFEPAHTAIVDAAFTDYVKAIQPKRDSTAFIKLNSYLPNDLVYTAKTSSPQLAVFSEIYYKDGWDAFVDGKPSDYIRVNYVLRAMMIPAGTHTIEFKFEPKHYAIGEKVSLASSVLLIIGCMFLLFQQFRQPKAQE